MRATDLSRRHALILGSALVVAGCAPAEATPARAEKAGGRVAHPSAPARVPDPARIRADELGRIPVMMYHRVVPTVGGEYDTTTADFTATLEAMLGGGYRPMSTATLVSGTLAVAAGATPVVLTFDDGTPDQVRLTRDGSLDPGCAAGLLVEACRQAGCQPAGSFYVNRNPFGAQDDAHRFDVLQAVEGAGFEIGNHTLDHANLATLSDERVQRQFVELQRLVRDAVGHDPTTMALPFGVFPRTRRLAAAGVWDGERYRHRGTLLVGANPSPSPFAITFERTAIPRIRSTSWHGGEVPMTGRPWLEDLKAHPGTRYVSAGDPAKVTFPSDREPSLSRTYASRAVTY